MTEEELVEEVESLHAEIEAVHDQIDRLVLASGWKTQTGGLLSTLGVSVKLRDVVDHVLPLLKGVKP